MLTPSGWSVRQRITKYVFNNDASYDQVWGNFPEEDLAFGMARALNLVLTDHQKEVLIALSRDQKITVDPKTFRILIRKGLVSGPYNSLTKKGFDTGRALAYHAEQKK